MLLVRWFLIVGIMPSLLFHCGAYVFFRVVVCLRRNNKKQNKKRPFLCTPRIFRRSWDELELHQASNEQTLLINRSFRLHFFPIDFELSAPLLNKHKPNHITISIIDFFLRFFGHSIPHPENYEYSRYHYSSAPPALPF